MEKHIVVSGAFSTGKTTLFESLVEKLPGHYAIEEGAREYIRSLGIPVDEMSIVQKQELQRYQIWHQMYHHNEAAKEKRPVLTDASIIEAYAYSFDLMPQKDLHMIEDLLHSFSDHYHVLLLPPVLPLVSDGQRHTDSDYRVSIHHRISSILEAYKIKYDTILGMAPTDRLDEAMSYIMDMPWPVMAE